MYEKHELWCKIGLTYYLDEYPLITVYWEVFYYRRSYTKSLDSERVNYNIETIYDFYLVS